MLTLPRRATNLHHHRIISRCINETISRCNYEYCRLAGISLCPWRRIFAQMHTIKAYSSTAALLHSYLLIPSSSAFPSRHHLFLHSTALHHRIPACCFLRVSMAWWTNQTKDYNVQWHGSQPSAPWTFSGGMKYLHVTTSASLVFVCKMGSLWIFNFPSIMHPGRHSPYLQVATHLPPRRRSRSWREIEKIQ